MPLNLLPAAILIVATPFLVKAQTATLTPLRRTVLEGEDANFTCSPLVGIASSVLNTIAPGENVSEAIQNTDPRISVTDIMGDPDVRVFTWLDASRDDDGRQFFCLFGAVVSNTSTLFVNYEVTLSLDSPTEITRMDGEDLNILFSVDGNPTPTLQLTLDGEVVEDSSTRSLTTTGLSFTPVGPGDAGMYDLTASNVVNSVTVSFEVTVRHLPIFEAVGGTLSMREGATFTIDCSATAFPAVSNITLTKDGDTIEFDSENMITITGAESQDAGTYLCTAVNELGPSTLTTVVEIGRLPGVVSNIQVDTTDNKRVMITWEAAANNGAAITHYEVEITYKEESFAADVSMMMTSISLTREDLGIPQDGGDIALSISVTAVNGIGRGLTTTENTTAEFDDISSGGTTIIPQALLSILLMMAYTALVLF